MAYLANSPDRNLHRSRRGSLNDLALESPGYHRNLLAIAHLLLSELPRLPLLPRLARLPIRGDAGVDCETLTCQPRLQDAAHHLQRPGLNDPTSDGLRTAHADVEDALESEEEPVCGMLVVGLGQEGRFEWFGVG